MMVPPEEIVDYLKVHLEPKVALLLEYKIPTNLMSTELGTKIIFVCINDPHTAVYPPIRIMFTDSMLACVSPLPDTGNFIVDIADPSCFPACVDWLAEEMMRLRNLWEEACIKQV